LLLIVNSSAFADREDHKEFGDDFPSVVASTWLELLYDVVKAETALDEARQARDDHAAREQALHAELEQTRQRLQTALEAARQALARITSMESSKFWKLRRIWFRLKRCVGLGMNE
jgi:hypothetical protein